MTQNVILHGERGHLSEAPRLFFMVNQVLAVALSGWFLLGSGYAALDRWFHLGWRAGNGVRRLFLFACSVIYMLRLTFNLFHTLRRRIGWQEAWATRSSCTSCTSSLTCWAVGWPRRRDRATPWPASCS